MVYGFGSWRHGVRGYGYEALHDLPTVSVTSPTNEQLFTTGGPSLTFTWTYSQAQADPQAYYRVVVSNDAGSTTYYDTGWVAGSDVSLAVNLPDQGVPGDTTDVSVIVYVRSDYGDDYEANSGLRPFRLQWGIPTISVTEPDPVENTSLISAQWTYADTRSKLQAKYRVRLMTPELVVLWDSGWTVSAGTSVSIPVALADGTTYRVGIQVENSEGVKS